MRTRPHAHAVRLVAGLIAGATLAVSTPVVADRQISADDRRCVQASGADGDLAVVNLTPVNERGPGHGRFVPPDVIESGELSNVNFVGAGVDPNVAVAPIGDGGWVCYDGGFGQAHLVIDDLGSVAAGRFTPATEAGAGLRVVDTRLDGVAVAPRERRCFAVAGAPGDAAIVNLTPVEAQGLGFGLLVSSDVASTPDTSNVNFGPGTVDPNVAIAPIGTDGEVCYVNSRHTNVHLVADHLATIHADAFTSATASGAGRRIADTRPSGVAVGPNDRRCFTVTGSPGDAAVVNLTPVEADGPGFGLLVSSDVIEVPEGSNVNFGPGTVDPNVAIAPIGADGMVCYVNSRHTTVHLVADHLATIHADAYTPATTTAAPNRLLDTRRILPELLPTAGQTGRGALLCPTEQWCLVQRATSGSLAALPTTEIEISITMNGGASWTTARTPFVWNSVEMACAVGGMCMAFGRVPADDPDVSLPKPAAYRSFDHGRTWQLADQAPVNSALFVSQIELTCTSIEHCVAFWYTSGETILDPSVTVGTVIAHVTADGGVTWQRHVTPAPPDAVGYWSVDCPTATACLAVPGSFRDGDPTFSLRSDDGGRTWSAIEHERSVFGGALDCLSAQVCVAFANSTIGVRSTESVPSIHRTVDGGRNWERLRHPSRYLASLSCATSICVTQANDLLPAEAHSEAVGRIAASNDAGLSWSPIAKHVERIEPGNLSDPEAAVEVRVECPSDTTCFGLAVRDFGSSATFVRFDPSEG